MKPNMSANFSPSTYFLTPKEQISEVIIKLFYLDLTLHFVLNQPNFWGRKFSNAVLYGYLGLPFYLLGSPTRRLTCRIV